MIIRVLDGADLFFDYEALDDATLAARLAKFNEHKKSLLDTLRNAHERGPKSKPFDKDKAWRDLTAFTAFYFRQDSAKKKTMPTSKLEERLRKLKEALGSARTLIGEAMQDEVGGALYSSWCEANAYFRSDPDREPALTPVHFKVFDPIRTKNEFDKVSAGLATLESAASDAADDVPASKRGRPPILSRDDIWNLAALYRESTGLIPGACDGPFAKFVVKILAAQGRHNNDEERGKRVRGAIKHEGVVDAIVDTRKWALTNPAIRKWAPSPFEEEE